MEHTASIAHMVCTPWMCRITLQLPHVMGITLLSFLRLRYQVHLRWHARLRNALAKAAGSLARRESAFSAAALATKPHEHLPKFPIAFKAQKFKGYETGIKVAVASAEDSTGMGAASEDVPHYTEAEEFWRGRAKKITSETELEVRKGRGRGRSKRGRGVSRGRGRGRGKRSVGRPRGQTSEPVAAKEMPNGEYQQPTFYKDFARVPHEPLVIKESEFDLKPVVVKGSEVDHILNVSFGLYSSARKNTHVQAPN